MLQDLGPIVLIGGIIRDVAMYGNGEFNSDVDIVVKPFDISKFEEFMRSRNAVQNRFGGYSLEGYHWKVDVWALQQTWAHRAGHVQVLEFSDLLGATFFNCDAVIYDIAAKELIARNEYFEKLKKRILDVNLLPNANPLGNAVRALRYVILKDFCWGPGLSKFVLEQIESAGWQGLLEREQRSFGTTYISDFNHKKLEIDLLRHVSSANEEDFRAINYLKYEQLEINLKAPTGLSK
ncbi:MAG: hypothetical protein OYH76_09720 [Defluviicoccus sp.]|nr:hypothetical protein [Defluviicoccus sp.]MDE0276162.1 hypothetical protein [Defluviicoccus sp.]